MWSTSARSRCVAAIFPVELISNEYYLALEDQPLLFVVFHKRSQPPAHSLSPTRSKLVLCANKCWGCRATCISHITHVPGRDHVVPDDPSQGTTSSNMSSFSSESADMRVMLQQLIELFQSLSLTPHAAVSPPRSTIQSTASLLTATLPPVAKTWNSLPLEIQVRIMRESFFSNIDEKEYTTMSPANPLPNLALMNVERQCRQWFEGAILPDCVVVLVRIHSCSTCDTPEARRQASLFAITPGQPWENLLRKASTVVFTVQCRTSHCLRADTTDYVSGTIYVPHNRLSMLSMSQTVLRGLPNAHHRQITVHCNPQSQKGASLSVEVLDLFADILHSFQVGFNTVSWRAGHQRNIRSIKAGLPKTYPECSNPVEERAFHRALLRERAAKGSIQEAFLPALTRQYAASMSWTELNPYHRALFREFQTLLDNRAVSVHRLVETACDAFRRYTHDWKPPRATLPGETIPQSKMEDFIHSEIHGDCMLFLTCHGLADDMFRQFKQSRAHKADKSSSPSLIDRLSDMPDIRTALDRKIWMIIHHFFAHKEGTFREWAVVDVPYLVHVCAMLQAYMRYRFMYMICYSTFEKPLPKHQQDLLDVRSVCLFRGGMYPLLEELNGQIEAFRGTSEDQTRFARYNDYEIPTFLRKTRFLSDEFYGIRTNIGVTKWWSILKAAEAFHTLTRLRIPVIDTAHWDTVRVTFDDINITGNWSSWLDE